MNFRKSVQAPCNPGTGNKGETLKHLFEKLFSSTSNRICSNHESGLNSTFETAAFVSPQAKTVPHFRG
jgi:hypothetical protein